MSSKYERNPEFMVNLLSSSNMIIRRVCESCHIPEYKEIYYKRLTVPTSNSVLGGMINGPMDGSTENTCFSDYTLHSSYEDAIVGANPWPFCVDSTLVSLRYDSSSRYNMIYRMKSICIPHQMLKSSNFVCHHYTS